MSLAAESQDRKARLAQYKNLKRKTPTDQTSTSDLSLTAPDPTTDDNDASSAPALPLSGRNFDPLLRAPKLGFETSPATPANGTVESRAATLADQAIATAREQADRPVDLSSLRPNKGPNADLKREYERRLEESGLNARTERAIAAIVRERIAGQKQDNGVELVEATREREKEDAEERRREREAEEELVAV